MDSVPVLPPDTIPLKHQVAGHFYGKWKTKLGLLQRCSTGDVLKPLIDKRRGPREQRFYLDVFSDEAPENLRALRSFLPTLLGTYEFNGINYLMLENIIQTFDHPCVADIKIGRITYDCEATEEKIARSIRKYPPVSDTGFQLLGWQVYRPTDNLYEYHDKVFGRSLTKEELIHAIAHFYGAPMSDYRKVVRLVLEHLTALEHTMTEQHGLILIASSLLIVYEGEQAKENDQHHHSTKVDVRLVDFAHAFKQEEGVNANRPDENFLFGLRNYIDCLRKLLDDTFVYVAIDKLNHTTH